MLSDNQLKTPPENSEPLTVKLMRYSLGPRMRSRSMRVASTTLTRASSMSGASDDMSDLFSASTSNDGSCRSLLSKCLLILVVSVAMILARSSIDKDSIILK